MKRFEVPGIGVAVVKDGRTVFAKGYGVRKLGMGDRVDEHTLFGIASNTKAFTAAALGILVDEGKVKWDDPVQKHLPAFQLHDPYVTREITIRDLLSHRSGLGLGAGDLLFWPDTNVSRAQVIAAARWIQPSSSFRSRYAYNNLAFVVAGEVIAAVSGKSWDDFIRERIFQPLEMREARISSIGIGEGANTAAPHSRGWRLQGELKPIPATRDETWAAAAGIKAGLHDLTKWIIVQLNRGEHGGGKRLWSESVAREMWTPQTILPISEGFPALRAAKPSFAAYGLGWSLRDYRGRKIVSHGGGLTGMVTLTTLVPDEKLGIVVLTNQEEGGAMNAVTQTLLDSYFDAPATDWVEAYYSARQSVLQRAAEAEAKFADARVKDTRPSLEPSRYAGTYIDPWYGNLELAFDDDKLTARMARTPSMVADLEHWHYDTFKVRWRDNTIPDAFITFALNFRGQIDRVTITPVSTLADFSFDYNDLLFRPAPGLEKK